MKVKDILTKDNWCQLANFRDANNASCSSEEAVKCCLMGHIFKIYPQSEFCNVIPKILDRIKPLNSLQAFNDSKTFEEVKALVDELDV